MGKKTAEKQHKEKTRITPREATIAASTYFTELTGSERRASIEEIELSQDGKRWVVTLGFELLALTLPMGPQKYKVFQVNAFTGEVLSMKIREL